MLRVSRAPARPRRAREPAAARAQRSFPPSPRRDCAKGIPENEEQSTGMEKKEEIQTPDIFWSREPITGHKGTKENPAIIPSFNDHRVVGLEIEQACGAAFVRLRVRLRTAGLHQSSHVSCRQTTVRQR